MTSGIYTIENSINGKLYVGSAVNIRYRWNRHRYDLRKKKHHNKHLQKAWNKYGEESFLFSHIANCPEEYLIKLEQWFIDNMKPEYNIRTIADSCIGIKVTEEKREKLSKALKAAWRDKDNKLADSKIHRRISIVCYDANGKLLKVFNSIADAISELKVDRTNIQRVLEGKCSITNYYHFKYKSDIIQDYVDKPEVSSKMNKPVTVNGVLYKTIAEAIRKTGISRYQIERNQSK